MAVAVKVPSVGESIQEAFLAQWFKQDGDLVKKDEALFVLETDKVTLEVAAELEGSLKILVPAGQTVAIGATVGEIDPLGRSEAGASGPSGDAGQPEAQPEPGAEQEGVAEPAPEMEETGSTPPSASRNDLSPSVRRLVAEKGLDPAKIQGSGPAGRITKADVLFYLEQAPAGVPEPCAAPAELTEKQAPPAEVRKPMSPIRRRIAARLLEARRNTAMLTTFNEIDMSGAMALRKAYKQVFAEKYGVSLGFMSIFIKACVTALQEFAQINAFIEDDQIVYHNYQHIGVAIGSDRGLVVPVIRHAERLSFAQIEKAIVDYVAKIRENRLELADLEGGTFTVSNGGVYGSLLSTPILNTPQSGILGMHKIEKRPVVVDDQIVIRPMMYVALSYDHRIVDGREAVTFLKRIKELVEDPQRMLLEV